MNSEAHETSTTVGATIQRTGEIKLHDTHIAIWEELEGPGEHWEKLQAVEAVMAQIVRSLLDHLQGRGFVVGPDEFVERFIAGHGMTRRQATTWRARHGYGKKGDLECHVETGGRTAKIEFWQSLNVENPNGGRYDFDKFSRMPRPMRLQCVVEMVNVIRFFQTLGYSLSGDLKEPLARSVLRIAERRVEEGLTPLERYNRKAWPHEKRGADGWPIAFQDVYSRKDRDGVLLSPGDERYSYGGYGRSRRLVRGRVYPDGGMWWICSEDGAWFDKVNASDLFSSLPGDRLTRRTRRRPLSPKEQREERDRAQLDVVAAWRRTEREAPEMMRAWLRQGRAGA